MERDFMGLNSKVVEGCKDSGFAKSSGVPWSVPSQVPAPPHFLSHQSAELQKFLGGVPVAVPHPILPPTSFLAGTTGSCLLNAKATQLTIFYAGTVNVFDDITPEKAQAILLLAGNGCFSPHMAHTRPQVQSPPIKLAARDAACGSPSVNTPPNSALSSPISVSSHPVGQAGGSITADDEAKSPKTIDISANFVSKVEPPKLLASIGPAAPTAMIPSAFPQSRKASLARFFEKRKERLMNSAPYDLIKKPADNIKLTSDVPGLAASSVAGSNSVSTSMGSP